MSNSVCKVPFCSKSTSKTHRSLYCTQHLGETIKNKGLYKSIIPIGYLMVCKIHGPIKEDNVRIQLGKPRVSNGRRESVKVCNHCVRLRQSEQRTATSLKEKNRRKNNSLKYNFGITLEQYLEMESKQNKLCAICKNEETALHSFTKIPLELSVDHCHTTGKIRGLLCSTCNRGLGYFKDSPQLLGRAIEYLTYAKSTTEYQTSTL